jgi:hypothetical protein
MNGLRFANAVDDQFDDAVALLDHPLHVVKLSGQAIDI